MEGEERGKEAGRGEGTRREGAGESEKDGERNIGEEISVEGETKKRKKKKREETLSWAVIR